MNPDLLAACVAYLEATPAVTSAFGHTGQTTQFTKFWTDYAGGTDMPYLVFAEPQQSELYETPGQNDSGSEVWDGYIDANIYAVDKAQARQLGLLVTETLDDAPLVFSDAELIYFRCMSRAFDPDYGIGPDDTATAYKRILRFRFMSERDLP